MENNALFRDDIECQKLIMEAMKYHLLPERRPMLQSPRTKPRKSTVGTLFAVGGMDSTKGIGSRGTEGDTSCYQEALWRNGWFRDKDGKNEPGKQFWCQKVFKEW